MSEEIVAKIVENAPLAALAWKISEPLAEKLLGPTFEYLGTGGANLIQKSFENVSRVLQTAVKKSGDRLDNPGQVPPRVLKSIIDEAAYNEDRLAADYYGGVLASSRSGVNRDDRGVVFSKLISNLSTYQIRAHYISYTVFFNLANGTSKNIAIDTELNTFNIAMSMQSFIVAMDIIPEENISNIVPHIYNGLISRNLLGPIFAFGDSNYINQRFPSIQTNIPGTTFQPSLLGVELYLWAQGRGDIVLSGALDGSFLPSPEQGIILPTDVHLIAP
jgi:hypothetical protein